MGGAQTKANSHVPPHVEAEVMKVEGVREMGFTPGRGGAGWCGCEGRPVQHSQSNQAKAEPAE